MTWLVVRLCLSSRQLDRSLFVICIVCIRGQYDMVGCEIVPSAVSNESKNTSLPVESNFWLLFNCNGVQNNITYVYL